MIAMDKASLPGRPLALPMPGAASARVQRDNLALRALRKVKNLGLLLTLLLLWQAASTWMLDATTLPPPTAVLQAAWELVSTGELVRHLRYSLNREVVAFVWVTSSIPLGLAM